MRYIYIIFSLVAFSLSCSKNSNKQVQDDVLSVQDSVLLFNFLDSLSKNYSGDNDSLVNSSDFIVSNFPEHVAEINIKIAYIHFSKANYFLTEHYFEQAAQQYLKDSLLEKFAEQLTNIGVVKEMSGSYTGATKKYFEALEIFDNLNLELKSSMIYNNLGIVYQQLKENEKALKYYNKSLLISEKLNRPDISAKRYNNIAAVYEESGKDLDSSLYYYHKAYKIWLKDSNSGFLPIVENNIGYIYLLKNELIIADSLFKKALNISLKTGQKNNISQILRNQAQLLIVQKKYTRAIFKAEEAISLAKHSSNKEVQLESLKVLIKALEKINEFEKTNKKLKEYYQLQEELSGIEQKTQINQLNVLYQVREKEHQIQILELENKVQNRKLLQQGLIIFVLVFLLGGLFFVFRLQKKNNELKMIQMQRAIADYISQIEEIKESENRHKKLSDENFRNKIKQFYLTEREEEVLIFISKGYKNSEIAEKMFVSVNTIKTHTKNIFIKLDVRNRTEAARKAKLS
ncbi:MAG: tetratricopeptide repeat protein [Bacteroidota bacterium]